MLSKSSIKYIQSLHHKKFRDEKAVFIAEGNKVVMELLQSKQFDCEQLVGTSLWLSENKITLRKLYEGTLIEVKPSELEKVSTLSTAGNVLGIFKKPKEKPVRTKGKITLMLDTIQDPGNLGTIIRIADWFGIGTIICSAETADIYNPKVVQSTMGSLGRVNIVYTDLVEWMTANNGLQFYAAALEGKNISTLKNIKEAVIIIGNESKGISQDILQKANEKITIPKTGQAESLNAAVATGIILSHIIS